MSRALSALLAGLILCTGTGPATTLENTQSRVVVYTEDYKPLYFQDETGRIQGTATEFLRQIAGNAGIELELHIRPFKRGLNAVRNNADHCFLALWRTASREPDFTWVGPLETDGYGLFALKDSDISLSTVEDSFAFATGAVAGWTSTEELQRAGHDKLVLVDQDGLNVNMLKMGHTKLWLGGLISAPYVAAQHGVEIRNVLTMQEVELSLACNPRISRHLTDRLQASLQEYRKRVPVRNPKKLTQ
ncbi:substrate-binding periplasmic protein [Roseibium sp. Sym1]|uniref:substrate-binding periplasmic protein n=1 Tax=Roseibium sp. Sym1 TaxID=3016006 RepID=UPI0022B496B9|nr:transporter substrate-binding domain-containing protein [Roseibium sp. Sym1]